MRFRRILTAALIVLLYSCIGGGGGSFEFNSAKTYARIDKDLKEAEKWGLEAMAVEPNNASIPYFLATEVYKPLKKSSKVAQMYKEALSRTDNLIIDRPFQIGGEYINNVHDAIKYEAINYYNDATELYSKGKLTKAMPKFELSMALDPSIMQNYIALADIAYENGDLDQAIEYLDKGSRVNSNNELKIRKARYARDKEDYDLSLDVLKNIETEDQEMKLLIEKEVFVIHLEQEDYLTAIELGSTLVEKMFNTLGVDDLALAETCYNVAISYRYLGYDYYNSVLEVINSGTEEKDILKDALEDAKTAQEYLKNAKEKFYDASSFNPDDPTSSEYAKELNKIIKQLKDLFIPNIKENLEK